MFFNIISLNIASLLSELSFVIFITYILEPLILFSFFFFVSKSMWDYAINSSWFKVNACSILLVAILSIRLHLFQNSGLQTHFEIWMVLDGEDRKCPRIVEGRMDKCGELIGEYHKNRYTSTIDPNDLEWDGTWMYSGKTMGHLFL